MKLQYSCGTKVRRQRVTGSVLNGIDFIEVVPDQVHLEVHFLNTIVGSPSPDNFAVEGGVRIKGIRIIDVKPSLADQRLLEITASAAGDFSTYTLRIQKSATDPSPPDGYDQVLSAVAFSFRAACPSDFDCEVDKTCPETAEPAPVIDYLSKDYASFRRLMLDRLAVTLPEWSERNPADVLITLVELLAYVGDDLSYRQDAVAAEAYLGTCRRRISGRRHSRLLDYRMHEGCNARAWVAFETDAAVLDLPAGVKVVSGSPDQETQIGDLDTITDQSIVVFETMQDLIARHAHNQISLWTWGDSSCCLPRGATAASLVAVPGISLGKGDVVLFEEAVSPKTGHPADVDPSHRQVVRLTGAVSNRDQLYGVDLIDVEWDAADALTFPLCVSAEIDDPINPSSGTEVVEVAVARANVALADHGRWRAHAPILPVVVPSEGDYEPALPGTDLTFAQALTKADLKVPASAVAVTNPRKAVPAISLDSPAGQWLPNYDLLDSDRFSRGFVVEMEDDRVAHIRFGDGTHGRMPTPGDSFAARYREGSGTAGNVGREVLTRVVNQPGVSRARNPLPAVGGQDPEGLEAVKQLAPQAFRTNERAVTEADYRDVARRHPEVLDAAARMRWTGSWWTVFLTVERHGGRPVDLPFRTELTNFIDRFRLAGYDLEVQGPAYVPLDIAVTFCEKPGFFAEDVRQAMITALTGRPGAAAQRPFFAQDHFTFGRPLYLSQLYAALLAVPGVASAAVTRFQRWGKLAGDELKDGRITVAPLEVIQLANDRNFPEAGRLEVAAGGAA